MSKNALALVDCSNRDQLYQFLVDNLDRKTVKNEMISPYDDQLIGKMNFRYGGMEHAMFFTYARSSEYPGMRFRNHKIIYLSLGVNDISSDIFQQICSQFGGFVNYDDDLDIGWQKIERRKLADDDWAALAAVDPAVDPIAEIAEDATEQQEIRHILKLEQKDETQEETRKNQEPRRKEGRSDRRRNDKQERRGQRGERKEKDGNRPEHNRSEGSHTEGNRLEGSRPEGHRTASKSKHRPNNGQRSGQKKPARKLEKPVRNENQL